ncbi:MAG: aminoglycoside phosphotransferase family protein [Chthonomonadaceae bacterium]|nr:aminoglycoside phosphotransferase family protein [Chthonomonadaceae bacterium]
MPFDKTDIDVSLVSRLVATQFPRWAHLDVRPVELSGWDNKTFRLGDDMSIRLPSAERYAAQVEKEQRWLPKLAPLLPLPIPAPLAMGLPSEDYPWHWSVYKWLEGENATLERIADLSQFATDLAQFLVSLQRIDPADGPLYGGHNFFRGGPVATYDAETLRSIQILEDHIDTDAATTVWESALNATWQRPTVWIHGDIAAGNLLAARGQLSAVIDFGCMGIGDPACDLVIAWTFFSGKSRKAFREALPLDFDTWARGRGWALWKALITLVQHIDTNPIEEDKARHVIDEVLADHLLPS